VPKAAAPVGPSKGDGSDPRNVPGHASDENKIVALQNIFDSLIEKEGCKA